MEKKSISLLIGAKTVDGATFFATQVAKQLNETESYEVLKTFTAIKKDDITNSVGKKEYDIIICTEEMTGGQQIGAGSIKIWKETNPDIKIFVILKDDKRGARKVRSLFEKGYYDGIFVSDFTEGVEELKKLILKGRTKEEAAKYYQVEDLLAEEKKKEEEVAEERASAGDQTSKPQQTVQQTPAQQTVQPAPEATPQAAPVMSEPVPKEPARPVASPPAPAQERAAAPPLREDPMYNPIPQAAPGRPVQPAPTPPPVQPQVQPETQRQSSLLQTMARQSEPQQDGFDIGVTEFEHLKNEPQPQFVEKTMRTKTEINVSKHYVEEEHTMDEQRMAQRAAVQPNAPAGGYGRTGAAGFKPTISSFEGYVVDVISDTAIVLEVPTAHFLAARDFISQDKVNLVTPRLA